MRKMKINAVVLPLVLAASFGCLGACPARAEPIALKLKQGQVFTWTYKIRNTVLQDGKAPNGGESATPYTMRVLEAGADDYVVEFQQGQTQFDAAHAAASADPALKEIMSLMVRLKIRVALSNRGELGKIQNVEEVKAAGQEIIGRAVSMRPSQHEQELKKFLENMLASEESLRATFLKNTRSLFSCVDLDPADGAPSTTDTELPNAFGGDPLKGTRTTTVKHSPSRSDVAEATMVQNVDKESFIRMMNDLVVKATGKPAPKGAFEGIFADGGIKDEMHFTCDLSTGLAEVAALKRTMNVPGRRQENEEEFTAVK
jgi:hypothetical protein